VTSLAEHDRQRAERIATAQRRLQAWEAERAAIYRVALDAANDRLAAAGPWHAIAPWDSPRALAEAHAARAAWEARNPEPLPPQL
jgi:hypothetical protein